MKGYPHGNYGNADRATARSLALSVKPSARGGYSVPVNHGTRVWLPSAHRTILNIGIWYYLLHVEDSITMIALPTKAMWLKGAKQKPERNPGRELISHMPIRDS
ncbi:hypothetical protein BO83DRAFT_402921 [Aspergillus eucalypticola CBS 122712]|uniref:Uncharacterized protein n=1 Tax=Aspergillus eucalypticola (strain CBS 122712 / IBT 29274) TaxID=1448314 RepID=A0A317UQG8_ASPEC|nr:uncharacterized protein BO83DRAFT_402921 [Aspergillus eucalypticola CBS 122712]PWY63815.1 hypothetical protein BO83DRAFT_402921 [Aspergillus eucalypticola CBS 122712]